MPSPVLRWAVILIVVAIIAGCGSGTDCGSTGGASPSEGGDPQSTNGDGIGFKSAEREQPSEVESVECDVLAKVEELIQGIERNRRETAQLVLPSDRLRAARASLVAELLNLGLPAQKRVLAIVTRLQADTRTRQVWLPILVRFKLGSIKPYVEAIESRDMERWERREISSVLFRHHEAWSYRLAVTLANDEDQTTRRDALRALVQWRTEEARQIVLNKLVSDPWTDVRELAAGIGRSPLFGGSFEELEALIAALADSAVRVQVAAWWSLRRVVDYDIAPPPHPPSSGREGDSLERDEAQEPEEAMWREWYERNARRIRWDEEERKFRRK